MKWGGKYLLFVLFVGIAACASKNEFTEEGLTVLSEKDALAMDMGMLLEFYFRAHQAGPSTAQDLMTWIDDLSEDEQLVYSNAYHFLKRRGSKLVFTTESAIENDEMVKIMSVYNKKAVPKNGLYRAYVYLPLPEIGSE